MVAYLFMIFYLITFLHYIICFYIFCVQKPTTVNSAYNDCYIWISLYPRCNHLKNKSRDRGNNIFLRSISGVYCSIKLD
jgi:hypothetical protein